MRFQCLSSSENGDDFIDRPGGETADLFRAYDESKARGRRFRRELEDTLNRREAAALHKLEMARNPFKQIGRIRMQAFGDPNCGSEDRKDVWRWLNNYVKDNSEVNIP